MGEDDASDGNGPVETKAMSTFNSGPDIEICFFHVEAKDPEEIDPENDDEHQHRTEEDATSSSTLATQEDERVEQGNTLESTDLSRRSCARNQSLRQHILIKYLLYLKLHQDGS